MFLIAMAGVICFFTIPDKRERMLGSALLISFSYFCVLFFQKSQWIESTILIVVIGLTAIAYIVHGRFNGVLFLPQLIYLFYGMGRAFIVKELKQTFRRLKQTRN